jgi:hypothetical protein
VRLENKSSLFSDHDVTRFTERIFRILNSLHAGVYEGGVGMEEGQRYFSQTCGSDIDMREEFKSFAREIFQLSRVFENILFWR